MSRLDQDVETVDEGGDDGVRSPILIVGRRKERVFVIDQDLVEIFPVAPVDPIQDHALLGLRQAVYFIHDLDRDLREVAPYHSFPALVEFTEMGPADDLFLRLFGVSGDLATPDDPEGIPIEDGAHVFRRGGLAQTRLPDDEFLAPVEAGEEAKEKGGVE